MKCTEQEPKHYHFSHQLRRYELVCTYSKEIQAPFCSMAINSILNFCVVESTQTSRDRSTKDISWY